MTETNTDFKMPWGKYKGETIEEIPSNYLNWIVDHYYENDESHLKRDILKHAEKELNDRDLHGGHWDDDPWDE